jgi:hypothetical protein
VSISRLYTAELFKNRHFLKNRGENENKTVHLQSRENTIRTRAKVKKQVWLHPSSSHHT